MATGTVKWFSNEKGYGFITPDAGGEDVTDDPAAVWRATRPTSDISDTNGVRSC